MCRSVQLVSITTVMAVVVVGCGDDADDGGGSTDRDTGSPMDSGSQDTDGDATTDVGPDDVAADTDDVGDIDSAGDATELPPGAMRRYTVDSAIGRDAVCNDGTPAIFYHRYGSGENRNNWILYLKGGSGCFSPEACMDRWMRNRDLMTSDDPRWGEILSRGGMLSGDPEQNPDFHDWSVAYFVYCSSDGWGGDAEGGDELGEWHFRGYKIAEAIFADLANPAFFPDGTLFEANNVIVTGSSAGAGGVRIHIDWMAEALRNAGATDVRGLHDAGWYPDIYPADRFDDIRQSLIDGIIYTNAQLDPDCVDGTAEADRWRCIDAYHMAPYIDTPLFVYMDQYDPVDIGRTFIDPADEEVFRQGVVDLMAGRDGCFSPAVRSHEAMYRDDHWAGDELHQIPPNSAESVSYREVFGNWYFARPGPTCVIGDPP